MKKMAKISIVLLILASVVITAWTSVKVKEKEILEKFQPFFEVLHHIQNEYYDADKVNYEKLVDEAIRGLLAGLDDPFSNYLTKQDTIEARISTESKYGGLGIEVTYDAKNKAVKVVTPMDGTPAFRAGLKPGDLIITIDGSPVSDMTFIEAVNHLRGKPGTKVQIEVLREDKEGNMKKLKFEIVRELIKLVTVKYDLINTEKGNIGYVRIVRFSIPTSEELKKTLTKLFFEGGIVGLILDLRNNPGGLLSTAVDVTSMFLDEGVVVKVKGRTGFERVYRSRGNDFPNVPMVVLVNHGSASASEILSGALQDHKIAKLVGEKTFGKAAVQSVIPLSNGGELWLTTAHYFTPLGRDIHKKGIEPDYVVTEEASVTEQEKEERHRLEGMYLTSTKAIVDVEKDNQLRKGLEILLKMLEKK